MSFRDAMTVATILTVASIFTVFMPMHGYDVWESDFVRCLYDAFVFVGSSWITIFIALTGLQAYAKRETTPTQKGNGE